MKNRELILICYEEIFLYAAMISVFRFYFTGVDATIFVPEEIPSLLSVVYSNLPPIKKGKYIGRNE